VIRIAEVLVCVIVYVKVDAFVLDRHRDGIVFDRYLPACSSAEIIRTVQALSEEQPCPQVRAKVPGRNEAVRVEETTTSPLLPGALCPPYLVER
jgi:hypothetical protein